MKYKLELSASHPGRSREWLTSKAILEIELCSNILELQKAFLACHDLNRLHAEIPTNSCNVTWIVKNEFTNQFLSVETQKRADVERLTIHVAAEAHVTVRFLELSES